MGLLGSGRSHGLSSAWDGGLNPMQRRALPRGRTSPTIARQGASRGVQGVEAGRGRGRFSCAVPCLAVLWAEGERAGNEGMAVVSGKWALEGAVGGRAHIFSSAFPVGQPFKPSISPTSSTKSQVMKSAVLPGPQLLLVHFKFFRNGYCRFEPCPILGAPFEPNIL